MKFLSTHVGSLPGPETFNATAEHDEASLRVAVEWVVARQREAGLDIINEGELTKGGDWLSFMDARVGGFGGPPLPPGGSVLSQGRDRAVFADFYRYAAERHTLFYAPDDRIKAVRRFTAATGPVTYTGTAGPLRQTAVL